MNNNSYIIITKSSAGSGKTFNLALRFLHILLNISNNEQQNSIKNILAITFTNKATFEMQRRIILWMKLIYLDGKINNRPILEVLKSPLKLQKFSRSDTQPHILEKNFLSNFTDTKIKKIIEKNLLHILTYLNDFKVSTIDSFNTFILKALSFRLQLSPDFEISLNPESYFKMVLEELYQDIIDNDYIRKVFDDYISYLFHNSPDDLKWDINSSIMANINYLWIKEKETGKKFLFKTESSIQVTDELKNNINTLITYLKSPEYTGKINKKFITALEKTVSADDNNIDYSKLENWINKKFVPGELLNKTKEINLPAEIINLYEKIKLDIKNIVENKAQFRFNSVKNIYAIFQKKLDTIMKKNNILLINELNFRLKEILSRNKTEDILPELYYYLSEKYNHYLIDEFQDTSVLQWQNIEYLVNESFSEGGTLFVVGDEKQAIYRWRGGHREIVSEIEQKYHNNFYPAVESLYKLTLDTNYRSAEEIINFVNEKFNFDNIKNFLRLNNIDVNLIEPHISTFKEVSQKVQDENKNQGYVYAEIVKSASEKNNKVDVEDNIKEKLKTELHKLLVEYNYDYKDIAILCFKNDEINKVVEWLLEFKTNTYEEKIKELNIESEETISIKTHPIIKDIIYFLKFLNTPSDTLNLLNFLNGTLFKTFTNLDLSEIKLWYNSILLKEDKFSLYINLKEWQPEFWENYVEEFFTKIMYIPLYEFIQLIIHKWDLFNKFKDDTPYFLKFLEVVFNMTENSINNINEMLEEWESMEDKEFVLKVPENLNAIKLMTIHSSKGLEFPIVILPFLDTGSKNGNWFTEIENDNLNLYYITHKDFPFSKKLRYIYDLEKTKTKVDKINSLYVATTRAKKALIMFFLDHSKSSNYKRLFFNDNEQCIIKGELQKNEKSDIKTEQLDLTFNKIENIQLQWLDLLKFKVKSPDDISLNEFDAIKFGDAVHKILSYIKTYPDNNLDRIIKMVSRKSDISFSELKKTIEEFFENKNFLKFFQPDKNVQIYNEFEIVNKIGLSKRIDRLMIYDDKIIIIDYKTGEEYREKHNKQIIEYKNIISEIYPEKNIECYLFYIEEAKLREVK